MIILSSEPKAKLLVPQRRLEWDQPSAHGYNIPNQTRFRLTARLNDGAIIWRGWFDDREDADQFLWSLLRGEIIYDRDIWRLPNPQWHPDFGPDLTYDFAIVTFLTVAGSNRTYTKPTDWNNANNLVECVGGGGNGYSGQGVAYGGGGGGGGAYSATPNLTLAGNTNYWCGNYAEGSYFGYSGTNWNSSQIYADPGLSSTQVWYGGPGGLASNCRGTVKRDGGYSQNCYYGASGGGGAAGPNGSGGLGGFSVDGYASSGGGGGGANGGNHGNPGGQGLVGGKGGNNRLGSGGGDGGINGTNGGGGGGGAGYGYGQAAVHAGAGGGNDQCWDATHGCGGGSGGGGDGGDSTGIVGGYGYAGGNYGGGGGGGGAGTYSGSSGVGAQGIIVVTYTPVSTVSGFNMPMLGM